MGRTERRSNVRVEPPPWLVDENNQARREVENRRAHGDSLRSIWDDILERTDSALAKYDQPAAKPDNLMEGK